MLTTGEAVLEREVTGEMPGSGRVRHVLASWFPVRHEDKITGVGVVVVDITDRKSAELRLQGVLQQLPVGVAIVDADGSVCSATASSTRWGCARRPASART